VDGENAPTSGGRGPDGVDFGQDGDWKAQEDGNEPRDEVDYFIGDPSGDREQRDRAEACRSESAQLRKERTHMCIP
jgi:hypothetical protein